ncbi:MAG: transcriptional repressor [Mycoplasmatota bacterium]
MRYSKQREVIFEIVANRCDHPDANQIYLQAKEILPNISLGTVYRNLADLVKNNKINKISLKSGDRFDKTLNHHSHFYCECCNCLVDLEEVNYEKLFDEDLIVNNIEVVVSGICKECARRRK